MANTLLLFQDNHLDWMAEKLDGFVLKKPPLDLVDGPVFRLALGMLNKAVSPKVPDSYKDQFWEAMDKVAAEDYDDAGAEAFDIVIELVQDWTTLGEGIRELIIGALQIAKGALSSLD